VFGDHQPYFGCIDHLDRAFAWAERHRIAVLLDLHTVPNSQNGLDGGGPVRRLQMAPHCRALASC
jgi:glucan 1,3-beta-glucosidase